MNNEKVYSQVIREILGNYNNKDKTIIGLVHNLRIEFEQLQVDNDLLIKYIEKIGKFAYTKHCDADTNEHSDLYGIVEMCRKENVEKILKLKKR